MDHQDHVNLIKKGIPSKGIWADLGSGRGAFTLALADCLDNESYIYSVDVDQRALKNQELRIKTEFPEIQASFIQKDFTQLLELPPLDGILMANSLHFVQDKLPVLKLISSYLKDDGRLVLVEYDTAQGNYAVPYPITFAMWTQLAEDVGFSKTQLLATRPSSFLGQFFSSVSYM